MTEQKLPQPRPELGEAEAELLEEMARHNIHPPSIKWDAGFVRFTHPADGKKNDTGWYKVHSDCRPSGSFDYHGSSHGTITWTYKGYKQPDNGVDLAEQKKAWREKEKKRQKKKKINFCSIGHQYL